MSKSTNRKHSAEFKLGLLREHLVNNIPVSELCDRHSIKPSLFYVWKKELFDHGHMVFEQSRKQGSAVSKQAAKIQQLEEKLVRKNEVLSELMEEHIALKKHVGER